MPAVIGDGVVVTFAWVAEAATALIFERPLSDFFAAFDRCSCGHYEPEHWVDGLGGRARCEAPGCGCAEFEEVGV